MTRFVYLLSFIFGIVMFFVSAMLLSEGSYGSAAVIGSIGIVFAIIFYDAFKKMSDVVGEEDNIINEAKKNLENNKNLYQDALNTIESFKRRGIYGGYQVYDVYERDKYEKACSIVYDYEKNENIINNIKTKRFIRDAKTISAVVAGFVIGKNLSKKSRENDNK